MNPVALAIADSNLKLAEVAVLRALIADGAMTTGMLLSVSGVRDPRALRSATRRLLECRLIVRKRGVFAAKTHLLTAPLNARMLTPSKEGGSLRTPSPSKDGGDGVADAPPPQELITMNAELLLDIGGEGIGEVVCGTSEVRRPNVLGQLMSSWNIVMDGLLRNRGEAWLTPSERAYRLDIARWLLKMGNKADPDVDWVVQISKRWKRGKRRMV